MIKKNSAEYNVRIYWVYTILKVIVRVTAWSFVELPLSSLGWKTVPVYPYSCTLCIMQHVPWILIWSMEIKITCDLTMVEDTQTLFMLQKTLLWLFHYSIYSVCIMHASGPCTVKLTRCNLNLYLGCVYIPYCFRWPCKMWTKKLCTVSDMLGLTVTQTMHLLD